MGPFLESWSRREGEGRRGRRQGLGRVVYNSCCNSILFFGLVLTMSQIRTKQHGSLPDGLREFFFDSWTGVFSILGVAIYTDPALRQLQNQSQGQHSPWFSPESIHFRSRLPPFFFPRPKGCSTGRPSFFADTEDLASSLIEATRRKDQTVRGFGRGLFRHHSPELAVFSSPPKWWETETESSSRSLQPQIDLTYSGF